MDLFRKGSVSCLHDYSQSINIRMDHDQGNNPLAGHVTQNTGSHRMNHQQSRYSELYDQLQVIRFQSVF